MIHFSLKYAICVMCAVLGWAAFANYDGTPIGYHSVGIDTYGDGVTPVLDGECYALVWASGGHEFKGFRYDGTLVDPENNKIVDDDGMLYICPIAKDGKCPPVTFIVSSAFRNANRNGEYSIVVLDTRISESSLSVVRDGNSLSRVNGWGFAKVSKTKALMSVSPNCDSKSIFGSSANIASELPDDVRPPVITRFEFDRNGNAVVHFDNTMECFSYFVEYGKTTDSIGEFKDTTLVCGSDDAKQTFSVSIRNSDLPDESAFFKVSAKTDWTDGAVK